jgi:hypothetical protein
MGSIINMSRSNQDLQKFAFINYDSIDPTVKEQLLELKDNFDEENNSISWEKLNPTKYGVQLNNPSKTILIFTEKYDKYWNVYINEQKQDEKFHFMVNGYANGFYLNKNGTYSLTIEHDPQNWLSKSFIIVLLVFLFLTCYVGYLYYKDHAKQKSKV